MKYVQNFRTVGLSGLLRDEETYNFTSRNNSEKQLVYRYKENRFFLLDYGRKEIEVRPEARERLLAARRDFMSILRDIRRNDGTYRLAKGEHYMVAYRREFKRDCIGEKYLFDQKERNDLYRFVVFLGNGRLLQYLCTVDELLDRFDFAKLETKSISRNAKQKEFAAIKGSFPLFLSAVKHDRYLYHTMKYLAGIATQAEADEATAIDGKIRFVPEEKVYGEGVTVGGVEQICPSFFNRSERYSCTLTIDSREWKATWRPREHRLLIWQYFRYADATIEISDEIYDSLQRQAVKKYRTYG